LLFLSNQTKLKKKYIFDSVTLILFKKSKKKDKTKKEKIK
jgi:hypothetical protein